MSSDEYLLEIVVVVVVVVVVIVVVANFCSHWQARYNTAVIEWGSGYPVLARDRHSAPFCVDVPG